MNGYDVLFFTNSLLIGTGLAMDAFSVSLANGLNEPKMKKRRAILISGVFSVFQALMPLIGWFCVSTLRHYFTVFEKFIPYIALILLAFIGGKMLLEGIKKKTSEEAEEKQLTLMLLFIQGIATSIDALSVGFTISEYTLAQALVCALIIGAVTFAICFAGILIGRKFGTKLSDKASIFGGVILIIIGIEIFITGVFG